MDTYIYIYSACVCVTIATSWLVKTIINILLVSVTMQVLIVLFIVIAYISLWGVLPIVEGARGRGQKHAPSFIHYNINIIIYQFC